MPHHDTTALSGTIQHVFAHRFTLEADGTVHLADLGPKGAQAFPLAAGLQVTLEGERRPSEIKVARIAADGGTPVEIHHKTPNHPARPGPTRRSDPASALAAIVAAGWTPTAEPRRKPKHVEVLARRGEGAWTELHVDADGTIYGKRPPTPTSGVQPSPDLSGAADRAAPHPRATGSMPVRRSPPRLGPEIRWAISRRAGSRARASARTAAVMVWTSWTASGSAPTTSIPGTSTSSLTGPRARSASPAARAAADSVPRENTLARTVPAMPSCGTRCPG